MRRTIMRYVNLSYAMILSMVSTRVKKRFPTLDHLVEAGMFELLSLFILVFLKLMGWSLSLKLAKLWKITRFPSIILYRCVSANKSNRWRVFRVLCWLLLAVFPLVTQQQAWVKQFRDASQTEGFKSHLTIKITTVPEEQSISNRTRAGPGLSRWHYFLERVRFRSLLECLSSIKS